MEFSINSIDPEAFPKLFRFAKADLVRLHEALKMPGTFRLDNRSTVTSMHGLCIVLRRMAYTARFCDLESLLCRNESTLSRCFTCVAGWLYNRVHAKLHWDENRLTSECLERYATAAWEAGMPDASVWGFLDGTFRPCARPISNQREMYSGHKRRHGMKYQAIMAPDGLFAHLSGPYSGRRHDQRMLEYSKLPILLPRVAVDTHGERLNVYADRGYKHMACINSTFTRYVALHRPDNVEELHISARRVRSRREPLQREPVSDAQYLSSSKRVCVEWGFGNVVKQWEYLNGDKRLRSLGQPIAQWYVLGVFLTNCHVCVHGSQTTQTFHCPPPALEEYVSFFL